jgi:DNA-binding response OmpR family regulator
MVMRRLELARWRSHLRIIELEDHVSVRILIVEDDHKLGSLLERGLEQAGMRTERVATGEAALASATAATSDVIVLDIGLPEMDGFSVCAGLRRAGIWTPVLMLTARDAVEDRVRGLDGGADDYVPKPFSFDELAARIRALARRGPVERPVVFEAGDLRLDPAARRAWRGEVEFELSTTELALLETFLRHPGQTLDRDQLVHLAWSAHSDPRSNVVDVYVRYLREKVDRPFGVCSIETVRGAGYRLRADGGR